MSCTYLTHHKPDSMFVIRINIIQSRHSLAVTQAVTDAADCQCWVLPFEYGSSSAKLSDSNKDRQLCSRVAILSASAHKHITYLQVSQLCQLLEPCKGLIRGSLPQASFKESLKESLKQSVAMYRYMYIYACLQQRTSS